MINTDARSDSYFGEQPNEKHHFNQVGAMTRDVPVLLKSNRRTGISAQLLSNTTTDWNVVNTCDLTEHAQKISVPVVRWSITMFIICLAMAGNPQLLF